MLHSIEEFLGGEEIQRILVVEDTLMVVARATFHKHVRNNALGVLPSVRRMRVERGRAGVEVFYLERVVKDDQIVVRHGEIDLVVQHRGVP